jgi:hypothetical protein
LWLVDGRWRGCHTEHAGSRLFFYAWSLHQAGIGSGVNAPHIVLNARAQLKRRNSICEGEYNPDKDGIFVCGRIDPAVFKINLRLLLYDAERASTQDLWSSHSPWKPPQCKTVATRLTSAVPALI